MREDLDEVGVAAVEVWVDDRNLEAQDPAVGEVEEDTWGGRDFDPLSQTVDIDGCTWLQPSVFDCALEERGTWMFDCALEERGTWKA